MRAVHEPTEESAAHDTFRVNYLKNYLGEAEQLGSVPRSELEGVLRVESDGQARVGLRIHAAVRSRSFA